MGRDDPESGCQSHVRVPSDVREHGLRLATPTTMKLIVKGAKGKRVFDWGSYALVRDNVQHFIEYGRPNGRFPELHGIESAVDGGSYVADASRLRGEVLRATAALAALPLTEAALTSRTRAIMIGSHCAPQPRPSIDARLAGWDLPVSLGLGRCPDSRRRPFIEAVLSLTSEAVDGDLLQVRRVGDAPAFARASDTRDQR